MLLSRRQLLQLGGRAALCGPSLAAPVALNRAQTKPVPLKNIVTKCFHVGTFLKFRCYRNSDGTSISNKTYIDDDWFKAQGLLPVNVVYGSRFLEGQGAHSTLDTDRLQAIAREADPHYLVSLDAEAWDKYRFTPNKRTPNGKTIVENLVDVVRLFKQANPRVPTGLYSEAPQNSYGFNDQTVSHYSKLNPDYAAVARIVDYYSPALYSNAPFDGSNKDEMRWQQAASFACDACQQLDSINNTIKPVWPYISPAWQDENKKTRYLNYEQMSARLTFLKRLNTAGCILWLSSSASEEGLNEPLALNPYQGWFKAAIDFAQNN